MHADGVWQAVEGVLSKDMATVGSVPSKLKKTALSALFWDTSQQKFWKPALVKFGCNFFHMRKFHKT